MKQFNIFTSISMLALAASLFAFQNEADIPKEYEFTSFTVVESIVPSGLGRSRIISSLEEKDHEKFTDERNDHFERNEAKRRNIRVKNFEETKLLNFYNIAGIRFQNIAANDALVDSKVNSMLNNGWELKEIAAGVEASAGGEDNNGIFITRFYFQRELR